MHLTKKRQNSKKKRTQSDSGARKRVSVTRSQQSYLGIVYLYEPAIFIYTFRAMANEPALNGCATIEGLTTKFSSEEALKFAKKLYIHGGNISNWNRIKRKTTPSAADEVSDSFQYQKCSGVISVCSLDKNNLFFRLRP